MWTDRNVTQPGLGRYTQVRTSDGMQCHISFDCFVGSSPYLHGKMGDGNETLEKLTELCATLTSIELSVISEVLRNQRFSMTDLPDQLNAVSLLNFIQKMEYPRWLIAILINPILDHRRYEKTWARLEVTNDHILDMVALHLWINGDEFTINKITHMELIRRIAIYGMKKK